MANAISIRGLGAFLLIAGVLLTVTGLSRQSDGDHRQLLDSLRVVYEQPSDRWPTPHLDSGVAHRELGVVPPPLIDPVGDSLKETVSLGKILFHDPRLSGSNQISCGSCHASDLNWTDGRRVALGHDHHTTARNTPGIENVGHRSRLFWDGRAGSLEEQAPISIASPLEMNQNPTELPEKLQKIRGYLSLFDEAYGDTSITLERIIGALATYERTLASNKSDFDHFLLGNHKRLSDQQIWGLHLFRTKARCMNCHNGPLFTDEQFHNVGLTYYQRKYEDLGRYNITGNPEDVGKFLTPGLRNVLRTRPWFHNGIFDNIDGVLNMYNAGMPRTRPKPQQVNDPLFPETDPLLKPLQLSSEERDAIVSFLEAITTFPRRLSQPELPQ